MKNVYTDGRPGMPGRYFQIRALDMKSVQLKTAVCRNPKEHGKIKVKQGFYLSGTDSTWSAVEFQKSVDNGTITKCVDMTEEG